MDAVIGETIGKCRIEKELGQGGMGVVYLARHATLGTHVAVKVLSRDAAAASPTAAKRFVREAQLAARIRHPNLVAVMDADTDPGTGSSFIVMEYVEGETVASMIKAGPLDQHTAASIALGVAKALEAAAHQNVVHRDVKPGNILIAKDGTVKLADLGLAKDLEDPEKLTASSATIGTPFYMSPEMVQKKPYDTRTDVYSLGVTLFEMLTGHLPYKGESFFELAQHIVKSPVPDPRAERPELDAELSALTVKMLAKSREDRPARPGDVARLIDAWQSRGGRDWRMPAAFAVAALLIALAAVARYYLTGS